MAISAEASREKSVRKGHISTLHLWWARRPLVACRAAVYGALVPASQFVPNGGTDAQKKSLGRANAAKFITSLCQYPGSPQIIKEAQQQILKAHAERLSRETGKKITVEDIVAGHAPRPRVLDMFAGGGAIPLEALRLGCDAYALDLNPVAHIIQLCTLVYPQKFGKPDSSTHGMAGPKNEKGETTWGGLADEVRYWGNWVLDKVRAQIGDLYPLIPDPEFTPSRKGNGGSDEDAFAEPQHVMGFADDPQQRLKTRGGFLTPVAYLWTRTVQCKNPNCGATVPLVKQTWLCKKEGRYVALKMIALKGQERVCFEVVESQTAAGLGFDPEAFSKAGNATCPFCGTVADSDYVKQKGCAGQIANQFMAVACTREGRQGKVYLPAENVPSFTLDEDVIKKRINDLSKRTGLTVPSEPIVDDAKNSFWARLYGMTNYGQLFTHRQMLTLLTFSAAIRGVADVLTPTSPEHAKATVTLLAAMVDKLADFDSTQCMWNYTGGRGVKNSFPRQGVPMAWDFAETNPFNPAGASWLSILEDTPAAVEMLTSVDLFGVVTRGSAASIAQPDGYFDAVITDPPYYDNVSYADLSDFFFVWLKRTVGHLYPEHFSGNGTPKKSEAVSDASRHEGDQTRAKTAYEEMMSHALGEAVRVLKPGGIFTIVYAHKTTLGWSTLVDALRRSGCEVVEAWPLDTERGARMIAVGSAALASSIFLVARKRDGATTGCEDQVRPELDSLASHSGQNWTLIPRFFEGS